MEVIRQNLRVNAQSFLTGLSNLVDVQKYDFNIFDKKVVLTVADGWDETLIDNLITSETLPQTQLNIEIDAANINSTAELYKKIKKESSIKDKVIHFDYDKTAQKLKFAVTTDWIGADTTTLDGVIDSLVGYDVVLQLMDSYVTKEKDGKRYYNKKRSQMVARIQDPDDTLTSEQAFQIDVKLQEVKNSLRTGDWITAKTYLGLTVVDAVYTQSIKDEYDAEIQDYINNNY